MDDQMHDQMREAGNTMRAAIDYCGHRMLWGDSDADLSRVLRLLFPALSEAGRQACIQVARESWRAWRVCRAN